MVSLERTRDHILANYGHDIYLQRRTADGWARTEDGRYALERHTVRHNYPANRGLPQTAQERPEGIVNNVDMLYYFHEAANPHERDRIYEIDEEGRPSTGVTFTIDYALPMRGRNGEIVYWVAGCTRETPN